MIRFSYFPSVTWLFMALLFVFGLQSCSDDEAPDIIPETIVENDSIPEDKEEEPDLNLMGNVEVLNADKVDDNYILVNDAASNRVYLMNKEALLLHEWKLTNNIGNDVFLLPNGKLLASLEADEPKIILGGKGGKLQFIANDGTVEWNYVHSSSEEETHHDVELLPNGNVLAMVWKRHSAEAATQSGFMLEAEIFVESIIEVNPTTDEIVWEWNSWDHLIQEHDDTKDNYGLVSEHPELIDINYVPNSEGTAEVQGDIMHANAIAYDEVNDVIFLSANFYSEVWVIDHSTTTEEAAQHGGGNYGKGGDLIYRFGNPDAYQNPQGTRLFYNNHFPNLLKGENQGKMLIFSNGKGFDQSTVYEMELPADYNLITNTDNELKVTWSFTDPDLYSAKVSGAVPLPNGNILITEGDFGFWEVTRDKEVVWKFNAEGFFWRGYSYSRNAPEIEQLGLPD
ncbi:aryl-sulfate sulfotransferase [Maribacter algicola]|uniref:Aryl-sulfate sulfotransferase n=1 Tax=Meishania litoralis TaxID=3434685 RepID=A0ACC7LH14_9FLAO